MCPSNARLRRARTNGPLLMADPWSGAIGAGIGAVASIFGGNKANKANAREARLNREFQDKLSRTAHQREVKDLRAAGLNPILSATGGSGASTPSGSQATQENIGKGVTSALALRSQNAEIDNIKSSTQLTRQKTMNEFQTNKIRRGEEIRAILDEEYFSSNSGKALYNFNKRLKHATDWVPGIGFILGGRGGGSRSRSKLPNKPQAPAGRFKRPTVY